MKLFHMSSALLCFALVLSAQAWFGESAPETVDEDEPADGSKHHKYEQKIETDAEDHDEDDDDEFGEHQHDFDHDAFLGKEESDAFDHMEPTEAKERLADIAAKVDTDHDSFVTVDELKAWLKKVHDDQVARDVRQLWLQYGVTEGNSLSWDTYIDHNWGGPNSAIYRSEPKAVDHDRQKWIAADSNRDGKLTKDEFIDFEHPEFSDHLKTFAAKETIPDVDQNGDGKVSKAEYLAEVESNEAKLKFNKTQHEAKFLDFDKDKSGHLDEVEMVPWLFGDNYLTTEAQHLLKEADDDEDGKLSLEEIIQNYQVFVGSEMIPTHDEL